MSIGIGSTWGEDSSPSFGETVYVVLDLEAAPKDAVWAVCSTRSKAEAAAAELNSMRVGGAITTISEERIDW